MTNFYSSHAWMISIWTFTNNLYSQRASSRFLPLLSVMSLLAPGQSPSATAGQTRLPVTWAPPRTPALALLPAHHGGI